MPLEASRLSTDEIKSLIKDNWGYNVTEIIHLSLGSANCYLIDGETVDYTNPLPEIYRQPEIQIEAAQMLNFAFRRTEICRELERNAGEISESLRKLV